MGLDITVYQNIVKKEFTKEQLQQDDDFVWENSDFMAFVISEDWMDRIKNLENRARYEGDNVFDKFSIGYSGYSRFRDGLARLTGKGKNWREVQLRNDVPFFELLDFADNEGCFDWDVSAELYKDFVEYHNAALETNEEVFIHHYEQMMKVVEFGKDNGVVVFH